jgi:hypothetical protein
MQKLEVSEIKKLSKVLRSKHTGSRLPFRASEIERFAVKVEVDAVTGCWNWLGGLSQGYGSFGKTSSHRFIWKYLFDSIPEGFDIDHLCRNKKCCNPLHLEPVTRLENIRRAAAMITHCPKNHPYNAENTIYDKHGWRFCRMCRVNYTRWFWESWEKRQLQNH